MPSEGNQNASTDMSRGHESEKRRWRERDHEQQQSSLD
jgi:hypothetical protein